MDIEIGSSPAARGTLVGHPAGLDRLRFIPARAGNTCRMARSSLAASVHPRPRGEHAKTSPSDSIRSGSSPPARGTRRAAAGVLRDRRFIPARAGNTSACWVAPRWATVHPRPRGEHVGKVWGGGIQIGSSPPARGTHNTIRDSMKRNRFIPARAGNTYTPNGSRQLCTVHPRPRGEHASTCRIPSPPTGSSPPARGTRPRERPRRRADRFIPARAGNTITQTPPIAPQPVHPRPRGEHEPAADVWRRDGGSSPPARGTRCDRVRRAAWSRFIPARAGNTLTSWPWARRITVHPRPRGEHRLQFREQHGRFGSSPPARGTRLAVSLPWSRLRFIPARAGNTSSARRPRQTTPVHPRPRGEHVVDVEITSASTGSSPPARGTPLGSRRFPCPERFIPARAGNTRTTMS